MLLDLLDIDINNNLVLIISVFRLDVIDDSLDFYSVRTFYDDTHCDYNKNEEGRKETFEKPEELVNIEYYI